MAEGRLPWTLPDAASYSAIAMHNGGAFERREIRMFTAEVLPGNFPMLKVFEQSGLPLMCSLSPQACAKLLNCPSTHFYIHYRRQRRARSEGHSLETRDRFSQYLRTELSMAAAALRVRRLISSALKLLNFCVE